MVVGLIFSGLVGLVFGTVGMAILASGGRAEEIEKETILRDALNKVHQWHKDEEARDFPEDAVEDALKLD